LVDAVDRADRQAFATAGAELGDDDHVDPVVEDGAELRRAVAQAGVAVDALRHLDAEHGQLPLGVALARLHPLLAGAGGHHYKRCAALVRGRAKRPMPRTGALASAVTGAPPLPPRPPPPNDP